MYNVVIKITIFEYAYLTGHLIVEPVLLGMHNYYTHLSICNNNCWTYLIKITCRFNFQMFCHEYIRNHL